MKKRAWLALGLLVGILGLTLAVTESVLRAPVGAEEGMAGMMGTAGRAVEGPGNLVQIKDVDVRLSDHGPVVLLKAENRVIPVFVDPTVAGSIHGALTGEKLRRPLSHDLMHSILQGFGGRVTQTVITLKDGTYYGALTVTMPNQTKVFDSRSSDAIALAIHFKAPILVGRDLLESSGKPDSESKELSL